MSCPEVQCQLQAEVVTEPCSSTRVRGGLGGKVPCADSVSNRGWGCEHTNYYDKSYMYLQIITNHTCIYYNYKYYGWSSHLHHLAARCCVHAPVAEVVGGREQREKAGEDERERERESTRK
jgi:hypothetical protein